MNLLVNKSQRYAVVMSKSACFNRQNAKTHQRQLEGHSGSTDLHQGHRATRFISKIIRIMSKCRCAKLKPHYLSFVIYM